jgi:hypothetical protein
VAQEDRTNAIAKSKIFFISDPPFLSPRHDKK